MGKENVEREFELLLNKLSDVGPVSFDLSFDPENGDDSGEISEFNVRENELKQIVDILDWFKRVDAAYLDRIYEKIIRNRSQNILEAIKK